MKVSETVVKVTCDVCGLRIDSGETRFEVAIKKAYADDPDPNKRAGKYEDVCGDCIESLFDG